MVPIVDAVTPAKTEEDKKQTVDVASDAYKGKSYDKSKPSLLVQKAQIALNKMFNSKLKTDGVLGPQTGQAMQMYKNKYNDNRSIWDPELQKSISTKI